MREDIADESARGEASFDAIVLTPESARSELQIRALRVERHRTEMSDQLVAAAWAVMDMLRYDPSVVRQSLSVRASRAMRRKFSRFLSPEALMRHGLFLPNWYAQRYPEHRGAGSPWAHYMAEGLRNDLAPNPLFDPTWYRARYMLDPATFDEPAITHYLRIGGRHALSPGPLFDASAYLRDYPELAATTDPLLDFIIRGVMAGRRIKPVFIPFSIG